LRRLALPAILALAAALRFAALGWGLRHVPHWDERVFVENARAMVVAGDFDHRYYEYPGLFFYILLPVLRALPDAALAGSGAYLAARAVVAAFGVLSVALVGVLGRRLLPPQAALSAALLLAVSPLEVVTAHMVRPDVVLGAFVLLALFAFLRLGERWRGDLLSGVAVGAASALKFTGLLLVPSYLAARLVAPGPRLARLAGAGLAALAVALVFTPYALIHPDAYLGGVAVQVGEHYRGRSTAPPYLDQVVYYAGTVGDAFGPVGGLLVALGALSVGREWRSWLPLLLHPLVTIATLSTAEIRFQRHLVPAAGLLALFAGRGVAVLGRAWPPAAPLALALAAFTPFSAALDYVRGLGLPSNRDHALDWAEASLAHGSRALTTVEGLGLDEERWEVLRRRGLDAEGLLLARDVDAVIVRGNDADGLRGLARDLARVSIPETRNPHAGVPVAIFQPAGGRARRSALPIEAAAIRVSRGGPVAALVDGDEATAWDTGAPQRPGDFLELRWRSAVCLARIELSLGSRGTDHAGALQVLASPDGASWSRVAAVPGRPPVARQVARPRSQLLLVEPVEVRGLRLVQAGRRGRPWAVAELRLYGPPGLD
jgi:hypothetical protein